MEQLPSESSEDDASGSKNERLAEKGEANASSTDSGAEDDEGAKDAEEEGARTKDLRRMCQ